MSSNYTQTLSQGEEFWMVKHNYSCSCALVQGPKLIVKAFSSNSKLATVTEAIKKVLLLMRCELQIDLLCSPKWNVPSVLRLLGVSFHHGRPCGFPDQICFSCPCNVCSLFSWSTPNYFLSTSDVFFLISIVFAEELALSFFKVATVVISAIVNNPIGLLFTQDKPETLNN